MNGFGASVKAALGTLLIMYGILDFIYNKVQKANDLKKNQMDYALANLPTGVDKQKFIDANRNIGGASDLFPMAGVAGTTLNSDEEKKNQHLFDSLSAQYDMQEAKRKSDLDSTIANINVYVDKSGNVTSDANGGTKVMTNGITTTSTTAK